MLQLDSVNVLARSHYLPMFSRLGRYGKTRLDRWTARSGELFEYWGHEASLLAVEDHRWFRWRMQNMRPWSRVRHIEEERPGFIDAVLDEVAAHGPLRVGDLVDAGDRTGPWWGYAPGKIALEWLFATGRITAYRDGNFTRVYDLPERVLPAAALGGHSPDRSEAYRELLGRSIRHLGVATAADLADYYRLHGPTARPLLADLAAEGRLGVVDVPGWKGPVYADPDAALPRRRAGTALLSPFDPLVWNRDRVERLFDFTYRIEIYVPSDQRIYGYYVLPFLLDGHLVARVDLKLDRKANRLLVRSAHVEEGAEVNRTATALKTELETMAGWLEADEVVVERRGNLAGALATPW